MSAQKTVLEARGLVKTFRGGGRHFTAVDKVSLALAQGEVLGIAGESGCGKTTLARMLIGLTRPDAGEILLHGQRVSYARGRSCFADAGRVQMVFQNAFSALDPRMTALDTLTEGMIIRKMYDAPERRQRALELLDRVGIDAARADSRTGSFSGGERQRIGIARALALEPDCLICDEPVSALDVSVQAQILELLKALRHERQMSMIFISHDLGVLRQISDRLIVLYRGMTVESGPCDAVCELPLHPYTRLLIESARMNAETPPAPGDPACSGGCPFYPRCGARRPECLSAVPPLLVPMPEREVRCGLVGNGLRRRQSAAR